MEIKPKYLTFDEYEDIGGGLLKESLFNIIERKAEKTIDKYTFNRFSEITEYPEELKMCVYDLIPLLNSDSSDITSESIGSYSITRKTSAERNESIVDIIKTYLSNTKVNNQFVLYAGADEN